MRPMKREADGGGEWSRGWKTLAGATGAVGSGAALFNYSAGYFVKPLEASLGWSRTEIAFGHTLMLSMAALMMPIMGALVDRFSIRVIGPVAFITYGLMCFALAGMSPVLPVYYALMLCLAIPWTGTTANVFAPLVASNFAERRGTALGIMMSGTAIMMIPLAPVIQQVINGFGWFAGYILLGSIALLIGIPCALLANWTSRAPADISLMPVAGLSLREAVRTLNYWKLLLAAASATVGIGGFLNQIPALVSDKGLDVIQVGLIGSVFVASVSVGRIGVGLLLDLLRPSAVAFGAMLASAMGAFLFLISGPSFLLCATATFLIGFAMGTEGDLQAFFTARLFGLRAFAAIFGTLGTVAVIGLGSGSLMFGRIYDVTGNYDMALLIAAGLLILSGALFASLRERQRDEREGTLIPLEA